MAAPAPATLQGHSPQQHTLDITMGMTLTGPLKGLENWELLQ